MPSSSLRGVAGADLAHLDAGAELAGEVPHQVAEVDALLGVEVHGARRARGHLDVDDLHHQTPAARDPLAGLDRPLLALAPFRFPSGSSSVASRSTRG